MHYSPDRVFRRALVSTHFTSSTLHTNSSSRILEECTRNLNCSSCIYTLVKNIRILYPATKTARKLCQLPIFVNCHTYMKEISGSKKGMCPSIDTLADFELACVEECKEDTSCAGDKKCCSNGCGHTCQLPYISREDYTPLMCKVLQ